jgi:hypothetical protein
MAPIGRFRMHGFGFLSMGLVGGDGMQGCRAELLHAQTNRHHTTTVIKRRKCK